MKKSLPYVNSLSTFTINLNKSKSSEIYHASSIHNPQVLMFRIHGSDKRKKIILQKKKERINHKNPEAHPF